MKWSGRNKQIKKEEQALTMKTQKYRKNNENNENKKDDTTDKSHNDRKCGVCGRNNHKTHECSFKNKREIFHCDYCKKPWNNADVCYKRIKDEENNPKKKNNDESEMICMGIEENYQQMEILNEKEISDKNIWIIDSGATQHMTNNFACLYDVFDVETHVTMGNNSLETINKEGKVKLLIDDTRIILKNVCFVPNLNYNIFSMTVAMNKGFEVCGRGEDLRLKSGLHTLVSNYKIHTTNGFILGFRVQPSYEKSLITYSTLHQRLGHPGQKSTLETGKNIGTKVTTLPNNIRCEDCELAKARIQDLLKFNSKPCFQLGERLYMDLSWINHDSIGGKRYWILLIDEVSRMSWSNFVKKSRT